MSKQTNEEKSAGVSFATVLEAAGVINPEFWKLEIEDVDKFKRRLTVVNQKTGLRASRVVHLQKLKGRTLLNIAADMVKGQAELELGSRNHQQPRNAEDFFKYAASMGFRIVQEFQDAKSGKQWVVYENPRPNVPQRNDQKPEPDYWVTGDELDWQPGYQFNGSRWLVQKIKLEDDERLVIQKAVHEDIKENQFEFTGSKNPFVNVEKLVTEPTHDSTWRLYQSIDGKTKHWIDILKQPAYDRYYFDGEPLYFIAERVIEGSKA